MSFGISLGDIISTTRLAWSTFHALKSAPEEFSALTLEVLSLHTTLKSLADEETYSTTSILHYASPQRQEALRLLLEHCAKGLQQLEKLVHGCTSLGPGERRRFFERVDFAGRGKQSPRDRLAVHTASLNIFLTGLTHGSLGRLEHLFRSGLEPMLARANGTSVNLESKELVKDPVLMRTASSAYGSDHDGFDSAWAVIGRRLVKEAGLSQEDIFNNGEEILDEMKEFFEVVKLRKRGYRIQKTINAIHDNTQQYTPRSLHRTIGDNNYATYGGHRARESSPPSRDKEGNGTASLQPNIDLDARKPQDYSTSEQNSPETSAGVGRGNSVGLEQNNNSTEISNTIKTEVPSSSTAREQYIARKKQEEESKSDDEVQDTFRKIERERALIKGCEAMLKATNNPVARTRAEKQMQDSRRNIEYLEKLLHQQAAKTAGMTVVHEESKKTEAPQPPPKDGGYDWRPQSTAMPQRHPYGTNGGNEPWSTTYTSAMPKCASGPVDSMKDPVDNLVDLFNDAFAIDGSVLAAAS